MAIVFIEGFDKYGPARTTAFSAGSLWNGAQTTMLTTLMAGEWNNVSALTTSGIVAPLSATGAALGIGQAGRVFKTLAGNYAKAIGGLRFNPQTLSGPNQLAVFNDTSTLQGGVGIDALGRAIVVNSAGTVIATSATSISISTTHYIEWEIQITNSGTYKVWIDGTLVINGSGGNFHGTANNFYNSLGIGNSGGIGVPIVAFDDLYVDDGNGAVLNTNPVVETKFTISDSAVQFTIQAYALGAWQNPTSTSLVSGVSLVLRKFTAPAGGATLNSISVVPTATNGTSKFKAVLYADSAGSPAALTATGTEVTGVVLRTPTILPFAAPQTLVAGTAYWIGFITDTSASFNCSDDTTLTWTKTNTYASGAPNPAGVATSTTGASITIWGNCTGTTTNFLEEANNPSLGLWGDYSYVSDATVNHEDLFGMAGLTANPATIHMVAVKAFMKDSDAGARTITLRTKSSATDDPGTNTGTNPGTTYTWQSSYWAQDPNGPTGWTKTNLDAAKAGYKITA